jgi:hypothetical protein
MSDAKGLTTRVHEPKAPVGERTVPESEQQTGETGFEMEFKRRLEDLQARYPQVSEIDAQPRRSAR